MCSSQPGYSRNNTIPLRQAQAFDNRQNSYLPTARKWIPEEIIMNPSRIKNDNAFANEIIPKT